MFRNTPPRTGHNNSGIDTEHSPSLLRRTVAVLVIYAACLGISTAFFVALFHVDSIKFTNTFFYNGCVYLIVSSYVHRKENMAGTAENKRCHMRFLYLLRFYDGVVLLNPGHG